MESDKARWLAYKQEVAAELYKKAVQGLRSQKWHWYSYHFQTKFLHPFAVSLIDACADCEIHLPGAGKRFIQRLVSFGGVEKDDGHYDQLLQCLSEILVTRQITRIAWGGEAFIEMEPRAPKGEKVPDVVVQTNRETFGFEIKAPKYLAYAKLRGERRHQVVSRVGAAKSGLGTTNASLPRDNTVKDFLVSADQKFSLHKKKGNFTGILVIVWDDHIYEAVSALSHPVCGLLTPESYFKKDGKPVHFSNIDGVIVVRHITHFTHAAGDVPLDGKQHAFDFCDAYGLPNIYFPVRDGLAVPGNVLDGLRALPFDHERLTNMAEYLPLDGVAFLN